MPLIIDAIDINAIVDKVDIEHVIDRVDINKIVSRVDIDQILDVIRAQGVGLDDFIFRWGNRLVGRRSKVADWPEGPPLLVKQRVTA